jgi:hypothetical protein
LHLAGIVLMEFFFFNTIYVSTLLLLLITIRMCAHTLHTLSDPRYRNGAALRDHFSLWDPTPRIS